MHLSLRYPQALITQMAQTAICNRHHSLDQQPCRWLLPSLDRLRGNELVNAIHGSAAFRSVDSSCFVAVMSTKVITAPSMTLSSLR